MKKKESQKVWVARYLVKHGSITTAQYVGWKKGIKLTNRIGEIEDASGQEISRERVKWGNTHGTKYSVDLEGRMRIKKAFGL